MDMEEDDIDDTEVDKLILGMEDEVKQRKIKDMENDMEDEEALG